jgi:ABC-type Fe3+/spermidine/putrescine transport system ATPase subunit
MLKLTDINRRLGDFSLKDINLEIPEGQYYVLLGRSGAGKTQLLELIAGLEIPDRGSIFLDNVDITKHRIQDRKIGIVFQDYAVFPHMTVFGNIAYPLKVRKEDKKTIAEKVDKEAIAMNIRHLLDRSTDRLSGGELQRVALARTLITSPRLLLLDEPFSSLDTSLKDDLKRILRNLNKSGLTIIHVTHDYGDAISLAKKVGVIHNGSIMQEGSVNEVFKNPSNRFVARYAGIRNFFKVEILKENGLVTGITKHNNRFKIDREIPDKDSLLIIKSDNICLSKESPVENYDNKIRGKISEIIPSEFGVEITVDAGDLFFVNLPGAYFENQKFFEGDNVWVSFHSKAIIVLNGNC